MKKFVYYLMLITFICSFFLGFNQSEKTKMVFTDDGINSYVITFEEGTAEHYIDISQFDSVKCDDECVNDIADATIDMMCDHWSVHFDILTI